MQLHNISWYYMSCLYIYTFDIPLIMIILFFPLRWARIAWTEVGAQMICPLLNKLIYIVYIYIYTCCMNRELARWHFVRVSKNLHCQFALCCWACCHRSRRKRWPTLVAVYSCSSRLPQRPMWSMLLHEPDVIGRENAYENWSSRAHDNGDYSSDLPSEIASRWTEVHRIVSGFAFEFRLLDIAWMLLVHHISEKHAQIRIHVMMSTWQITWDSGGLCFSTACDML